MDTGFLKAFALLLAGMQTLLFAEAKPSVQDALDLARGKVSALRQDDGWESFNRALVATRAVPEETNRNDWKQIRNGKLALYLEIFAKLDSAIDPKWNAAIMPEPKFVNPGASVPYIPGMPLQKGTKPEILEMQRQADDQFKLDHAGYVQQARLRELKRQGEEQLQTYVRRLFDATEKELVDREIAKAVPNLKLRTEVEKAIHQR